MPPNVRLSLYSGKSEYKLAKIYDEYSIQCVDGDAYSDSLDEWYAVQLEVDGKVVPFLASEHMHNVIVDDRDPEAGSRALDTRKSVRPWPKDGKHYFKALDWQQVGEYRIMFWLTTPHHSRGEELCSWLKKHPLGFTCVVTDPEYEGRLAQLNLRQAVRSIEAHASKEEKALAYATTPLVAKETAWLGQRYKRLIGTDPSESELRTIAAAMHSELYLSATGAAEGGTAAASSASSAPSSRRTPSLVPLTPKDPSALAPFFESAAARLRRQEQARHSLQQGGGYTVQRVVAVPAGGGPAKGNLAGDVTAGAAGSSSSSSAALPAAKRQRREALLQDLVDASKAGDNGLSTLWQGLMLPDDKDASSEEVLEALLGGSSSSSSLAATGGAAASSKSAKSPSISDDAGWGTSARCRAKRDRSLYEPQHLAGPGEDYAQALRLQAKWSTAAAALDTMATSSGFSKEQKQRLMVKLDNLVSDDSLLRVHRYEAIPAGVTVPLWRGRHHELVRGVAASHGLPALQAVGLAATAATRRLRDLLVLDEEALEAGAAGREDVAGRSPRRRGPGRPPKQRTEGEVARQQRRAGEEAEEVGEGEEGGDGTDPRVQASSSSSSVPTRGIPLRIDEKRLAKLVDEVDFLEAQAPAAAAPLPLAPAAAADDSAASSSSSSSSSAAEGAGGLQLQSASAAAGPSRVPDPSCGPAYPLGPELSYRLFTTCLADVVMGDLPDAAYFTPFLECVPEEGDRGAGGAAAGAAAELQGYEGVIRGSCELPPLPDDRRGKKRKTAGPARRAAAAAEGDAGAAAVADGAGTA